MGYRSSVMISRRHSIKIIGIICCLFAAIPIFRKSIALRHYRIATVQELKASKWIAYFPNLRTALEHRESFNSEYLTSPMKTIIKLDKYQKYKKWDVLHATITAFDEGGRRKQFGGDAFFITLRRPNHGTDGITCETTDNANGTYQVQCILPWEGQAALNAILVHPSESLIHLVKMYSSERHYGINLYTTMKNSNNGEEDTVCSVAFPDKRPDEVCDYSNPTHGEKRTCVKPRSGECSEIVWQNVGEDPDLKTIYDGHYFRKGYNFLATIKGDGTTVTVEETGEGNRILNSKPLQATSHDPMTPAGWFYNSTWISFKPSKRQGLVRSIRSCVRNNKLYFVGDSTIRMIYREFITKLKLNDTGLDNSVAWSRGRDAQDKSLNLEIHYRSHGPPILNPGPEDARPYISDTLDSITTGGKGSIVIITLGYHFHTLSADVFLRRLIIIKEVMKDMMRRLPGIRVVIKGLHYHVGNIPDRLWLTYRLEVLLRKEFVGMPGVTYVEMWDWTLVTRNKALHPVSTILEHMVDDILDAIC